MAYSVNSANLAGLSIQFKKLVQWLLGGDLQPRCLADRLLTSLGQPQINPQAQKETEKVCCSAEKGNYEQVNC